MKSSQWIQRGTMAALAMAAIAAFAQETPPTTDPQKKPDEPEEELIPVKWNSISLGFTSYKNNLSLGRYARPTRGLRLHDLSLLTPGTDSFPYARLNLRSFPNEDNLIDGMVALNRGNTIVRGSRKEHSFYVYEWRDVAPSEDQEIEWGVDHAFNSNFGGFFLYKSSDRDGRFPSPRETEHNRTRLTAGGFGGSLLGGNLGVNLAHRRTFDDSGAQPETLQRRIDATYSRDFGDRLSLSGSAGYAKIEQSGMRDSHIRSQALSGAWDLGPSTSLLFNFGQQTLDLNNVENAYVRKRHVAGAKLVSRLPGWSLQLGFKHKESERLRTDQSYVDVPKSNEYDARLAGKLGPARLTLRGSWEDLRATAVMNTIDSRQLLWDDRTMFQAKLDGGGDLFTAYGTYTYRFQQNKQRDVEIGWHNVAIGGTYAFSDKLSAFAEFATDDFRAKGGDEDGHGLDYYFPNARSLAAGVNWVKDPKVSASASLNFSETGNEKATQLTITVRRRINDDHDLEFALAPWRLDDRLYHISGYRTTFLMARYNVRF